MSEWQPIETAPVGTRLLFWWRPINDDNPHAEAVVIGSIPYPSTGQWWNDQTGKHQDIWHLTHWMPLPERPARNNASTSFEKDQCSACTSIEWCSENGCRLKAFEHIQVGPNNPDSSIEKAYADSLVGSFVEIVDIKPRDNDDKAQGNVS